MNTKTPIIKRNISPYSYNPKSDLDDLPFVETVGKGKNKCLSYWQVRPNGDYIDECLMGKSYAMEALQYMLATGINSVIKNAVLHMPRQKDRSGIEIGFLTEVSHFAIHGASAHAGR